MIYFLRYLLRFKSTALNPIKHQMYLLPRAISSKSNTPAFTDRTRTVPHTRRQKLKHIMKEKSKQWWSAMPLMKWTTTSHSLQTIKQKQKTQPPPKKTQQKMTYGVGIQFLTWDRSKICGVVKPVKGITLIPCFRKGQILFCEKALWF